MCNHRRMGNHPMTLFFNSSVLEHVEAGTNYD